jgi:small-conductance mechanosensitive channel
MFRIFVVFIFSGIIALSAVSLDDLRDSLNDVDSDLDSNIWMTKYNNYNTYEKLKQELYNIESRLQRLNSQKNRVKYSSLRKLKIIKENEIELLKEYENSRFGSLTNIAIEENSDKVANPLMIIGAVSYIKQLQQQNIDLQKKLHSLKETVSNLKIKKSLLLSMTKQSKNVDSKNRYSLLYRDAARQYMDFDLEFTFFKTSAEVYQKKIDEIILDLKDQIIEQAISVAKLISWLLVLLFLSFVVKRIIKKYIDNDDILYTANKSVNIVLIVVVAMVLLFYFIANVSYIITLLGFASAGIAIALKDWFMSIFGWMSIVLSGSINPGDRIKVMRNGIEVVGDVLDITLLKIAVREDTTLTSYSKNRRTGRVFFIPNNYIFTDMIANYTFDGLKTVWDVVDINITFDSNHKKAVAIAKEIANKNARVYTDLAKKRLLKLRKKYVLRNSNPEPRIFSFVESYGITISTWFHTNSHATLGLRSVMGMDILDAFNKEDDIILAYPTNTINVNTQRNLEILEQLPLGKTVL